MTETKINFDYVWIELREPLERGKRALIYIGHAEPLYSILMNESHPSFSAQLAHICRMYPILCCHRAFLIAHAFLVLRVGFAFISWAVPFAYLIKNK